jgi:hypothetical protein
MFQKNENWINCISSYSTLEREMLTDAFQAITVCNLLNWFKSYSPELKYGFMFSKHDNLDKINAEMKYTSHSGASYGWTMRTIQKILRDKEILSLQNLQDLQDLQDQNEEEKFDMYVSRTCTRYGCVCPRNEKNEVDCKQIFAPTSSDIVYIYLK